LLSGEGEVAPRARAGEVVLSEVSGYGVSGVGVDEVEEDVALDGIAREGEGDRLAGVSSAESFGVPVAVFDASTAGGVGGECGAIGATGRYKSGSRSSSKFYWGATK